MYEVSKIREEALYWSKIVDKVIEGEISVSHKNSTAINELEGRLTEIELIIQNDIGEYQKSLQNIGILFCKWRKKNITTKITTLEECLKEVREKKKKLDSYRI